MLPLPASSPPPPPPAIVAPSDTAVAPLPLANPDDPASLGVPLPLPAVSSAVPESDGEAEALNVGSGRMRMPLSFDQTLGLGLAFGGAPLDGSQQLGSGWSNAIDRRITLPMQRARLGQTYFAMDTLPGRNIRQVTVQTGQPPADADLNFDGWQAAMRFGLRRPFVAPSEDGLVPIFDFPNRLSLDWAEARLGVEGLLVSGVLTRSGFRLAGFSLEEGYLRSTAQRARTWALANLPIVIPTGLAVAGGAAYAGAQYLVLTKRELSTPLSWTVLNWKGLVLRPTLRPVLSYKDFLRFGGAELTIAYWLRPNIQVLVIPRYIHDSLLGAPGFSSSGRISFAVSDQVVGGAELHVGSTGAMASYLGVRAGF